ncbi:LPXTG cell wall anchor domain-containing protein [Listeria seeligeri]|uniref:LPXTG cell wall anchor domain-containing protein n=1 Tax=Listeria seeligeri TaxID=1640 RepID=UPI0016270C46|nr:LPXTG cell wall anchor domain-containing protein [Listeria seeligeri]
MKSVFIQFSLSHVSAQASENTLPKTGDSSSYWVLLGLLCVGIAGFTWNKKRI